MSGRRVSKPCFVPVVLLALNAACVRGVAFGQRSELYSKPIVNGPYGNDLKECKAVWNTISSDAEKVADCMEKLLYGVAIKLKDPRGIPALGLESAEPVTLPVVQLADSAIMSGRLTNASVFGITDCLNPASCKITYDPSTQIATVVTKCRRLRATARYEMKLNIGNLFLAHNFDQVNAAGAAGNGGSITGGNVKLTVDDVVNTMKMTMRQLKKGGLVVSKVASETSFGDFKMELIPDDPDDPLFGLLNSITNSREAVLALAQEMFLPVFSTETAKRAGTIFHKGWRALEKM